MLTRDKDFIASKIQLKDKAFYTDAKTIIEFPKWYQDKNMYDISDTTYIYGVFAIIIDGKYAVSIIPTILTTDPVMVTEVERDGETYIQMVYGKGDVIFSSDTVIMHSLLSYNFFEAFYMQAKIPWFIEYDDICKIIDHMPRYAASNLGANHISNEVVSSFIARQASNKLIFYRQDPKNKPVFVDLMDVRYSTMSTVSKLAGNYFEESLVGAIVQKEKTSTVLENIVRR